MLHRLAKALARFVCRRRGHLFVFADRDGTYTTFCETCGVEKT